MPKTMNINLNFDTATSTATESLKNLQDSVNTYTTSTGTSDIESIYRECLHNTCPHLLPCGDCAITMRYCHHGGWNWKPEWTCKSED